MSTTTSLVLGSGGARGLAHIGVIRCLLEHNFDIRYVAGSSIGALIGGIYAMDKLEAYTHWVSALERMDVVRLLDLSFDGGALFKGNRIIGVLKDIIGERNIEDLPIGYTAVCADLSAHGAHSEVWLNRGPLFDAIRASMSTPTVFEPIRADDYLLVDGGVVNPVPVAPTLNDRTQVTVAVNLNGRHLPGASLPVAPEPPPNALQLAYRQRIGQYVDKYLTKPEPETTHKAGFSQVAINSLELMQSVITEFRFAANPPSILIDIPHDLCGFMDFHRATELIDFGYEQAERALQEYKGTC